MPRFYFHLRNEEGLSRDAVGIEFPSLDEAYLEAFRAATDIWRELLLSRKDPRTHSFEITDASDEVLLVLPFEETLEGARPLKRQAHLSNAYASLQAAFERNATVTAAIASEIRAARNNLAESKFLLRHLDRLHPVSLHL